MFLHRTQDGRFQTAVEVAIWEDYLSRNKTNIRKTLAHYSLDNGPLDGDGNALIFRFTEYDWDKNVRDMLVASNIYFTVNGEERINVQDQLLKKKIFVAEDDPDIRYSLSVMLQDAGYHVKSACSGKPIVDGNFSWVDLFILDKRMPDIDGLEVCRHLRSQPVTKSIPVILISASGAGGRAALEAGANDYIEKPFQMHYLLNVVSKYTRRVGH